MKTLNENKWNDVILSKNASKKTSRAYFGPIFWTIVGIVATVIIGGVSIGLSINAYNHRYDSNAVAAGSIEYTFKSGQNAGAGSLVASAGTLEYGYYQKSGAKNTKYSISYKRNNDTTYLFLRDVNVVSNNDYVGSYDIKFNKYSQAYDLRVEKKSKTSNKSVFYIDWGVR